MQTRPVEQDTVAILAGGGGRGGGRCVPDGANTWLWVSSVLALLRTLLWAAHCIPAYAHALGRRGG